MELMFVAGERRNSSSGALLEISNPATLETYESVPDASPEDAETALRVALEGRIAWARTPLHERIAIVDRFLKILKDREVELAEIITRETGKPLSESIDEIDTTYWIFRGFAERVGPSMYGMATELDLQPGLPGDYMITRREPIGVIVAILPFNFPIEMYAHKVAPALLAGNSVVVKPSEDTPLSALKLTEWLYECGTPGHALQCLTGRGEVVGEALVSSPLTQAITMTGSTEVGTRVYENGAKHLSKVFLELGGNDPLIVLPDANLQWAVDMTTRGRTYCAGQCCCANKRMIVHESVFDEFTDRLLKKLDGMEPADPLSEDTKLGTLINQEAAKQVESQIRHTVSEGAKIKLGGEASGAFFSPTVLLNVSSEMDIARDMEVFAPVFPLISAGSDEEMVRVANNTKYGLNAGVFTQDVDKAFTFAAVLECGLVVINGTPLYRPYNHPHGGFKKTGIGREGLDSTIQEMTEVKGIAFRKVINYDAQ